MAPITLNMAPAQTKNKNQQRRRPQPIEINRAVPKHEGHQSRQVLSPRSHPRISPQTVFPYHIDEENEVIYKMANDGTWTMKSPGEKDERHSGTLVRWAGVPQSLQFNYDWVLTKIAAQARSSDLKRVINQLMRVRQAHDVCEFPTRKVPVSHLGESRSTVSIYGAGALLNPDGSYATLVDWDHFLDDAKNASNVMQMRRRWNMQGSKKVARWCLWGRSQMVKNRTEFAEDIGAGYVIKKILEGHDISSTRLGYRREQECDWGSNVKGPWDPKARTGHDKAVIAWCEDGAGCGVRAPSQC